jgi:hypothetical protein
VAHDHDHDHDHHDDDEARFLKVRAMARALNVDRFTVEVMRSLADDGIDAILLKGPAIARWLYDDAALRWYADCDLLVSPADTGRAEAVLAQLGYDRGPLDSIDGDWERHARTWMRADSANVDLHQTLAGAGVEPAEVWSVLSPRTERMHLVGEDVTVLDPAARAVVVALHAAKDGPRVDKVRHDLGHAVERVPFTVWRDAAALAARLDAVAPFAAGLRLDPAGAAIADALELPADETVLVALRSAGAPPMAVGLEWLLEERSARRRLHVVARKLFPPRAYLEASSAIARHGRVGLLVGYAARPFVVIARAPRAALAVRRARRRARSSRRG